MFEKVLKKIKPSKNEEQETLKIVNEFLTKINSKLVNAVSIVGGSFAKGTWLKEQHDIDVFVLFNNETNMSLRLEVAIKSAFDKCEKIHGSRDYFITNYKNLSFELVPVLKIDKAQDAKNITDVSPMHVDWVKENINSKIADEIRLAKQFMKANGCYGAETFLGGFSGYLVELLVIHYGGFIKFVKEATNWKHGLVISVGENRFSSEQKFPLVVIDPVQPNRNAAAALRHEKFDLFVELCKKFINKNNDSFFKEKKINLNKYNLVFKVTPLDGSKDVVGTKMLKAFEKIKKSLDENEFGFSDSGWHWNEYAYFYFKIKNKTLSKEKKHFGPPIKFENDANKFKIKHRKFKIRQENERLYVLLPRRFTKLKDFVNDIANDKEIMSKVNTMIKL